ncbi:MAG: hypothetical protein PHP70_03680 [Gallionella sp.]|nr:hypothetical protein [Gallionella sp.]
MACEADKPHPADRPKNFVVNFFGHSMSLDRVGLPLFTLTLRQLDSLSYYGYLLPYDAVYMLDDVVVLSIGIITLSQRRLQEQEGRWLKLVSGLVMVGLGVYLLLATH